ncbi:sulfurtransferase [Arcobacter arenosus]|uniref:Sulfurtransferase n=1 Tax=Arcobacter arenosus TaxID=2576037 RepID=A0A5R8Y2A3_9BACT|nr:rhodanese-like domain-containing protein [Arcobacter arenosus]TLP39404.1 sulfurtransferase [Arcobacter arenosus]
MLRLFLVSLTLFFITSNLFADKLSIELEDLSKVISSSKVIDARSSDLFLKGHLKDSVNLPATITYENKSKNGKITTPTKMQEIIQNLGINVNDSILIYDDGTFFDASRVFWSLEVYGFENVKLINAGFNELKKNSFEISKNPTKVKKSDYIVSINNKRLATKFSTQIATKNDSQIIIDARPEESYVGKKSVAKRFGHIPKAINIPAGHNINDKGENLKLKTLDELKEVYKSLDKNKKIVIYCKIGRIASTNYFALRELGFDVANYDASWKEWGNDFSLPVVNLSEN